MRRQNKFPLSIDFLLDDKYDIDTEDYWTLEEEDKKILTNLLFGFYQHNFDMQAPYIYWYIHSLIDQTNRAELNNEFEKADIIKRLIEKMENNL